MIGQCTPKYWPVKQKAIALSSAGAGFCATTRAVSDSKGLKPLGEDFGEDLSTVVAVDAQATISLRFEHCVDKSHHIDTVEL